MSRWQVASIFILTACGGGASDKPVAKPGSGPAYSVAEPSPEVMGLAADFRGSCAFARPPGKAGDYALALQVAQVGEGAVRVRSRAVFDDEDRDHLIGEIDGGTELRGAGPIRASGVKGGTGYAVLVRDPKGHVCRGYLGDYAVEVVDSR